MAVLAWPASGAAAPPDRYIVVLQEGADSDAVAKEHGRRYGASVRFVYGDALDGYAAQIPPDRLGEVRSDPRVAYVEPDGEVTAFTTQSNATWGLDRVDQRSLPLSGTFSYNNTGSGVSAYIVDTGIRFSHSDFGARAVSGYDSVDGGTADDCNGHGTHVAGTTGGGAWGVAKGVSLVAVRVLNCNGSGTISGVIAGVNWVTSDHDPGESAIANMSLGGGASSSLDTAVKNSIADGVSYAVAAGNGNRGGVAQDACKYSPARVAEAITIGATDKTDKKASWSNYGNCVDWFAPGVGITSAWHTSATATNTISGTSMATPHTAGVAALYLQSNPGASPATVRTALYDNATKGIVTSSRTANNHLLFTDY
jgi:subtilisin family serine protease